MSDGAEMLHTQQKHTYYVHLLRSSSELCVYKLLQVNSLVYAGSVNTSATDKIC